MMKNCPNCNVPLKLTKAESLELDVCSGGCGGIWFDMFELKKVDEPSEQLTDEILQLSASLPIESKEVSSHIKNCPNCPDEVMVRRHYDIFEQVEVDQCLLCSGIWLDKGELDLIRSQFNTEQERNAAGDKFVGEKLCSVKDLVNDRIVFYESLAEDNKEKNKYSLAVMKKLAGFLG